MCGAHRYCTIFFGFQRCLLSFATMPSYLDDAVTAMPGNKQFAFLEFHDLDMVPEGHQTSYVVLTRDKARTYPIITKLQQIANNAKGEACARAWPRQRFDSIN